MTFEQFQALAPEHADTLSPELAALALDRAGRWEAAHDRASKVETLQTNRVHAYLHRKEGDLGNARYWYDRVGEAIPEESLDDEWSALAQRFL